MRTQEQIVQKIKETSTLLGSTGDVLVDYLDFEHAKELLRPEATKKAWASDLGNFAGFGPPTNRTRPVPPGDREFIIESMKHYMDFALDKARSGRGISAARSLEKFSAWLWLLGDDELSEKVAGDYEQYGLPHLKAICEKYGFRY